MLYCSRSFNCSGVNSREAFIASSIKFSEKVISSSTSNGFEPVLS